jgi:hypothetical protein
MPSCTSRSSLFLAAACHTGAEQADIQAEHAHKDPARAEAVKGAE